MAWYAQNLDALTNQFGTYTITVNSTVDAGAPHHQTVVGLEMSERLDFVAGDLGDMMMTLTVMEDTDAIPGGWWNEVLGGDCEISILLNDGGGDDHLFSGSVLKAEIEMEELYIGTPNVRRITIPCVGLLKKLESVSIADLITELESHMVTDDAATGKFVKIVDVINSALALAFSQAFDTDYTQLADAGGNDFLFTNTGTAYSWSVTQVYWRMQVNSGGYAHDGYTDSADDYYWGEHYDNALELVRAVCKNFAMVPQYYYDLSDSKHKIRLLQRGRCYTSAITLPAPMNSTFQPTGGTPLTKILAVDWNDDDEGWVFTEGKVIVIGLSAPVWHVPEGFNADLQIPMMWNCLEDSPYTATIAECAILRGVDPADVSYPVDKVTAYNYFTETTTNYENGGTASTHRPFAKAMAEFYRYRYYIEGLKEYRRTYHTLLPTGSTWDALKIMAVTTIGAETFAVTELTRDFLSGETSVTLLELS